MSSIDVVADACVLIPAALRDTLLRAAAAGMYRIHWSEDILSEVERNLISLGLTAPAAAGRLVSVMRREFPEAETPANLYQSLAPTMTNSPKDRHVLAAAVVAHAQVIVTSNLKHFPDAALAPLAVEAQSPDEFLTSLLDLDSDGMEEIIRSQAEDLRNPPMSVLDVLEVLGRDAPNFAGSMLMRPFLAMPDLGAPQEY